MRCEFVGIIPARWASSRFPGKPLIDLLGKPMIVRVHEQAVKWDKFDTVYVATDDQRIASVCESCGIPCLMTSNKHVDCLDRAYEAALILDGRGEGAHRYIIIQGDEPLFDVRTLDISDTPPCVNFYTESKTDIDDPNAVKVVMDIHSRALYFSRYPVPHKKLGMEWVGKPFPTYKQLGVYIFSLEMLGIYNGLKPSMLEIAESVGLNRLLENCCMVNMEYTPYDSISVDTPADRDKVVRILKEQK